MNSSPRVVRKGKQVEEPRRLCGDEIEFFGQCVATGVLTGLEISRAQLGSNRGHRKDAAPPGLAPAKDSGVTVGSGSLFSRDGTVASAVMMITKSEIPPVQSGSCF